MRNSGRRAPGLEAIVGADHVSTPRRTGCLLGRRLLAAADVARSRRAARRRRIVIVHPGAPTRSPRSSQSPTSKDPGGALGRRLGHAGRRAADPWRHHRRRQAAGPDARDQRAVALRARAQAGINGGELECALNETGLTLPHYPASANCATLGGYLAPRGSGTISTKYGKAEDLVMSIEVVLRRRHA